MSKEVKKYYLISDAYGQFSARLYAPAGAEVTIISIHDDMAIVERNGIRFSTKNANISEGLDVKEVSAPAPVASGPKLPKKQRAKPKHSSLF